MMWIDYLESLIVALFVLVPSADEVGDESDHNQSGQHTAHNDGHEAASVLVQRTGLG